MSENEDIVQLFEELSAKCEELESELQQAKEDALSAMSFAEDARNYAQNAHESADTSDDRCAEALTTLADITPLLEQLRAKVDDPERLESTGLHADMERNKTQVMHHHNAGHKIRVIAESLSISEFLVEQIISKETNHA